MDAIDILGGLFGRKRGGSSQGPDLGEIFGRGKRSSSRGRSDTGSRSSSPEDVDRQADELEDLLNVAHKREANRRSNPRPSTPAAAPAPAPKRSTPADQGIPVDSPYSRRGDTATSQNEQALVLARAMINAAKADGQISPAEQQSIIEHFDGSSADAIQFLRDELSRPLDVRDFAWSVPLGMEQHVYATSLIAIDADSPAETQYLAELAHALRLSSDVCDQLRQRYRGGARHPSR